MREMREQTESELQTWKEGTIQVTVEDIDKAGWMFRERFKSLTRMDITHIIGMKLAVSVRDVDQMIERMKEE